MSIFGIKAKVGPKGAVGNVLKVLEERFELRKVLKNERGEIKTHKELKKDLFNHDIESFANDTAKADKLARVIAEENFLFVMNNNIMHKALIQLMKEADIRNSKMIEHINKKLSELKRNKVVKSEDYRELSKLLDELKGNQKLIGHISGDIKGKLNNVRTYLEELAATTNKGTIGPQLSLIETSSWFMRNYFVNYFSMRGKIKHGSKDVAKIRKELAIIEKDFDKLEKGGKREKTDKTYKEIIANERKFVHTLKESSEIFFKLIQRDCVIMHIIIKILREEMVEEVKAANKFEIPQAMASADRTRKDRLLGLIREGIHKEIQTEFQLWQYANAA